MTASRQLLARGTGASPGIATGAIVFDSDDALELAAKGTPTILVRIDASSDDVAAMRVAAGIVTTRGGITGDAAIVARTLGKPCIASCPPMRVDYTQNSVTVWGDSSKVDPVADIVLEKGTVITIDGGKGEIWLEA